jgi:hypothetical protein
MALVELTDFLLVTAGAVLGRDDDADHRPHVVEGVLVVGVGLVAFVAADVGAVVLRRAPFLVDGGGLLGVTLHALERLDSGFGGRRLLGGGQGRQRHSHQGQSQQNGQGSQSHESPP